MHYSLQPSLKAASGARERPPRPDAAAVASLCKAADAIGTRMQYSHQGFLPNARQQRAGGLAAIELAQTLRQLVCACRAELADCLGLGLMSRVCVLAGQAASCCWIQCPFKWPPCLPRRPCMQFSHQGSLPNVRQQLAGGLPAIELAQTLCQLVFACGPTAVRTRIHCRDNHSGLHAQSRRLHLGCACIDFEALVCCRQSCSCACAESAAAALPLMHALAWMQNGTSKCFDYAAAPPSASPISRLQMPVKSLRPHGLSSMGYKQLLLLKVEKQCAPGCTAY